MQNWPTTLETQFHSISQVCSSLIFSTTWHFSSLRTEVKVKAVTVQQLPQIFWRLTWKKRVFFTINMPCRQHDSQSRIQHNSSGQLDLNRNQHTPWLPEESWVGKGFISLSTIFWYKALKLNGSTVNGNVPVNIAYMFTPLKENIEKKKPK